MGTEASDRGNRKLWEEQKQIFLEGKDGMHKKGMLLGTKSCDRGEGNVKGLLPTAHWRLISVLWGVIL